MRLGDARCIHAILTAVGIAGVLGAQAPAGAAPEGQIAAMPTAPAAGSLSVDRARDLLAGQSGGAADLLGAPQWSPGSWLVPVNQLAPPGQPLAQAQPTPQAAAAADADAEEDTTDILDEVSVTGTRRAVRQRDTTATTYSIKKEDYNALGATTVTDGLALVPGFQASPALGGVRGIGDTFLRGFNDQRFQALRDGLSLTRSSNGRSDIFGYQAEDIERIEVLTGGATLRYGSGSVGGVINLITETPKGPPKLTLKYEVGSFGFNRYVAKYGGGDDTFSYNFVYTGIVAANDYPYRFTVPNTAQFYGPTSNPNATIPAAIPAKNTRGPNGSNTGNQYLPSPTGVINSFFLGNNDPANNGPVDLFGFLKPDVGPPLTLSGRYIAEEGQAASDSYSMKFSWKPDPANRLTARFNQQNRKYISGGPGGFADGVCTGNFSTAVNPVLSGQRILPVVPDPTAPGGARVVPCDQQRYIPLTPSGYLGLRSRIFPFNTSLNGGQIYETGNALSGERLFGVDFSGITQTNTSQTEAALFWDYDISPTTSLNSYAYYYRLTGNSWVPQPYFFNSNIETALGSATIAGPPGAFTAGATSQPYFQSDKIEVQTSLNTKLSPGQDLSFGLNLTEDRSYQQLTGGATFFDAAIARYSAFLIDDISFSDEWKANVGLRYQSSSAFGELLTPAAGLRFSPTRWISFRGNWSYVFNAPNLTALNLVGAGSIAGNTLKPETGVTYDIGFDLTPAPNLGLRFTYFSTYLNGVFGNAVRVNDGTFGPLNDPIRFPFVSGTVNLNGELATGIEAQLDWTISEQWRARISWTNTDARPFGLVDDINNNQFPYFYGYQKPEIPFNNVIGILSYRNRGLTANLIGKYDSGKRRFNSLDFVPAWFTLDLTTEIPITPSFTLTGGVFNLTDTQYEYIDSTPAPGLNFRVGARVEIGG